jgi:alpha-tubulin suppressor-like RCC1 family protein
MSSGELRCWGDNTYGQLGDNSTVDRLSPGMSILSSVSAVSGGHFHTCAIVAGAARCWGANGSGELGDASMTNRSTPGSDIGGLGAVSMIGTGNAHTCAAGEAGMRCWGSNSAWQLGMGTGAPDQTVPGSAILGTVKAIGLAFEGNHTCAVLNNGDVRCWGDNSVGQLGDGTMTNKAYPDGPAVVQGARAVSAGWQHTCALLENGTIKCWGRDYGVTPVDVATFCP